MSTIIGLTGSLATGKSTVAGIFAALGAKVIDADAIAHELMHPKGACFQSVVKLFGQDILSRGYIDRKKIAEIVFQDIKKLDQLVRIIHPEVRKEILKAIQSFKKGGKKKVVVVDVPLLFESKLHHYVDLSVVVKATQAQQVERAVDRLNITKAQARHRIKAQMPLREKIRLADIIIDNRGNITQIKKQVKRIWQELMQMQEKIK